MAYFKGSPDGDKISKVVTASDAEVTHDHTATDDSTAVDGGISSSDGRCGDIDIEEGIVFMVYARRP